MTEVVVVQHVNEHENVRIIGADRASAQVVERLTIQPSLKDRPEGFSMDGSPLGAAHWTSGAADAFADLDAEAG